MNEKIAFSLIHAAHSIEARLEESLATVNLSGAKFAALSPWWRQASHSAWASWLGSSPVSAPMSPSWWTAGSGRPGETN